MLQSKAYGLVVSAVLVISCAAQGCTSPKNHEGSVVSAEAQVVAAVPLLDQRIYVYKTDILPSGDVMKRWYWGAPWEVQAMNGKVLRRMYSPDASSESTTNAGPSITVILDPERGTVYEAYFIQKTTAIFTLPMTLYFFTTRDSPAPVFSLPFSDAPTRLCQDGRVSRGGIKSPGIAKSLFESVEWLGIGWEETPYEPC